MTVRELVQGIQREMLAGDLTPTQAADLSARATALIGNCQTEIREAENHYNVILLSHLDGEEAANRATIRAKTSAEYLRLREAEDTHRWLVQAVRSLNKILDGLIQEMRFTPR